MEINTINVHDISSLDKILGIIEGFIGNDVSACGTSTSDTSRTPTSISTNYGEFCCCFFTYLIENKRKYTETIMLSLLENISNTISKSLNRIDNGCFGFDEPTRKDLCEYGKNSKSILFKEYHLFHLKGHRYIKYFEQFLTCSNELDFTLLNLQKNILNLRHEEKSAQDIKNLFEKTIKIYESELVFHFNKLIDLQ